jgi:hypothetical protein
MGVVDVTGNGDGVLQLFDLGEGDRRKQQGIADALDAERVQPWRVIAAAELEQLATAGSPFTADDLVAVVGLPDTGQNRNNAIGGLFGSAAKRGTIRRTGFRRTERVLGHARTVSVWVGVRR